MKKKYSDEVIYLSKHTGISRYRCDIVLEECGGDINAAFAILEDISDNKYEKAMDNISALVHGEKGSIVTVKEGGDVIFRLPAVILILLLLLLDIPSWVIALVMLLFVVFRAEVEMNFTEKTEDPIRTVKTEEYVRQKKIEKRIEAKRKNSSYGEDGYNEITIE